MKKIMFMILLICLVLSITACTNAQKEDRLFENISNMELVLAEELHTELENDGYYVAESRLLDRLIYKATEIYDLYQKAEISDDEIESFIHLIQPIPDIFFEQGDADIANKIIYLYNSRMSLNYGIERINDKSYVSAFESFSEIISSDTYSVTKVNQIVNDAEIEEIKKDLSEDLENSILRAERPDYMCKNVSFVKMVIGEDDFEKFNNRIDVAIEKSYNESTDSSSYSSSGSSGGVCSWCNGTGMVRYYYGASALEAALDGYDDYTYGQCGSCLGSGRAR